MYIPQLEGSDLIGLVCHGGNWRCFATIVAEWILDFESYYPPSDDDLKDFRNGLYVVLPESGEAFCEALTSSEVSFPQMAAFIADRGPVRYPLEFVVNFDQHLYVNGFPDINVHRYVPPGWNAVRDDPLHYIPDFLRLLWEHELQH